MTKDKTIYEKVAIDILREIIVEFWGGSKGEVYVPPYIKRIIENYIGNFRVTTGGYPKMNIELLEKELSKDDTLIDLILIAFKSPEVKDKLYKKSYDLLKASYKESESWGDLFEEIYEDQPYLNEIFVRLVEEEGNVVITSAKQLQELTGITEIYGYWDEEKEETVPYGDKEPTKKEAQEIAFKQIEGTFISAMSWRYSEALKDILQAGGKYKDLLQVKPAYFNLPETWSGVLASDKESSILWAIEEVFTIGEPNSSVRPDLKVIAQEIEAPYSVLMDIHKMCH